MPICWRSKSKFSCFIEGNYFFSLSPFNKKNDANMFAVRKHAKM